jgi:hypothetical protein
MPSNRRKDEALEAPCKYCNGRGLIRDDGERHKCPICDGSGCEPTEFGRRILALVRRNFRPMFERMQNEE